MWHKGARGREQDRVQLVARLRQRGIRHRGVLDQLRTVPRHRFLATGMGALAYKDTALPIGHGQTLSQPYIVARMTELLLHELPPEPPRILEIGTGSGYQTAVLSGLVSQVYSIERVGALYREARERLAELGYENVRLRHGDGRWGWALHGPFAGILVTAAPESVPRELMDQLAERGRLVVPVGGQGQQTLMVIVRGGSGFREERWDAVSFVPLLDGSC